MRAIQALRRDVFALSPSKKTRTSLWGHGHVFLPLRTITSQTSGHTEYLANRQVEFKQYKQTNSGWTEYYPDPFKPTHNIKEFSHAFGQLESGARAHQHHVYLAGRISHVRDSSQKLVFYTLEENGDQLQVLCSKGQYQANFDITQVLRRGDIIGISGFPGKSKKGELSIIPFEIILLSPCLHDIPLKLQSSEVRHRQPYLDALVNKQKQAVALCRHAITSSIRRFLDSRGYVEVETPILWPKHGGATAQPFTTRSNAWGGMDLFMRVAPELFLKELVIAGIPRVYEIGKVFRNEGVDATHHPEFTTCELYQAFANYKDMMDLTEELLRLIARAVKAVDRRQAALLSSEGTAVSDNLCFDVFIPFRLPSSTLVIDDMDPSVGRKKVTIDFSKPFVRWDMKSMLEEKICGPLPNPNDPASEVALLALCEKFHIPVSAPHSCAHLVDKLLGLVEPHMMQPTFLMHHPRCLSPLAKQLPSNKDYTERFELFVAGMEVCNAYSELNDPVEQRKLFQAQAGDEEAMPVDEDFVTALEYGLPPTGGWGMGIDRLIMLLTNTPSIREILMFPLMRPRVSLHNNNNDAPGMHTSA